MNPAEKLAWARQLVARAHGIPVANVSVDDVALDVEGKLTVRARARVSVSAVEVTVGFQKPEGAP